MTLEALGITLGAGKLKPIGEAVSVPVNGSAPQALASYLESIPPAIEKWWAPASFKGNHREAAKWVDSSMYGCDLDFRGADGKHGPPDADTRTALRESIESGIFPGSLYHLSPCGARIVAILESVVSDAAAWEAGAHAFCRLIQAALEKTHLAATPTDGPNGRPLWVNGFVVDESASCDRARLYYTPRSIAKGVRRSDTVHVLREPLYTVEQFLKESPPPPKPAFPLRQPRAGEASASPEFAEARERWIRDHTEFWGRQGSGTCPICQGKGCFGVFKPDPSKWSCFDTDHPAPPPGLQGVKSVFGDALDLEMALTGFGQAEILKRDRYLIEPEVYVGSERKKEQKKAESEEPEKKEPPRKGLGPWDFAEVVDPSAGQVEWIIEGFAPKGMIVLGAAAWKTGKTLLKYAAVLDAHAGRPIWGRFAVARPLRCLVIQMEMPRSEDARRLRRLAIGAGDDPKAFPDFARTGELTWFSRPPLDLTSDEDRTLLQKMAEGAKPDLVLIDSVGAAFAAAADKLNDAGTVRRLLKVFDPITDTGAAIILLHHYRKGDANGDGKDAIMNSQAFGAACGRIYGLERLQGKDDYGFRVRLHPLGTWAPGDESDTILEVRDTEDGAGTTVQALDESSQLARGGLTAVQQAGLNAKHRVARRGRVSREDCITGAVGDLGISRRSAISGIDYARVKHWIQPVPSETDKKALDFIPGDEDETDK